MNAPLAPAQLSVIGHFIGGTAVNPSASRTQPVYNPARGTPSAQVALASAEDVDLAVAAARTAFPAWADTSAVKRARVMFKFKELVERHQDLLAKTITREHGKVFSDARG